MLSHPYQSPSCSCCGSSKWEAGGWERHALSGLRCSLMVLQRSLSPPSAHVSFAFFEARQAQAGSGVLLLRLPESYRTLPAAFAELNHWLLELGMDAHLCDLVFLLTKRQLLYVCEQDSTRDSVGQSLEVFCSCTQTSESISLNHINNINILLCHTVRVPSFVLIGQPRDEL